MTICEYCKNKGMNKEDYKNFKANIVATAKAISQNLKYKCGMYYPIDELFTTGSNSEMKDLIINELKKLNIEFKDNDTMYRVVEEIKQDEQKTNNNKTAEGFNIECLAESQNGYKILIGCKGIKEDKQIMKVGIYNSDTKECVYKTGNNLRLDFNNIIQYAETICITMDKYIDNKYNLNLILDRFFYDYNVRLLQTLQNKYLIEKVNTLKEIENNKFNNENIELEKELYNIADNKGLYILKGISNMYVLGLKDSRWKNRFYDKGTQDYFVKLIEKDENKNQLNKFVKDAEICIYYSSYGLDLYRCKSYNKILIDCINYIKYNIA